MAELNDGLVVELEWLAPVEEALDTRPDWSQVTRRLSPPWASATRPPARPRRVLVAVCALVVGAAVAVGAIAASGNWLWRNGPAGPQGSTQFEFHGSTYSLGLMVTQAPALRGLPGPIKAFSLVLARAERTGVPWLAVATGNGATSGLPQSKLRTVAGAPFGVLSYDSGGGQILFGDSQPWIRTIAITDSRGHVFKVRTVAPPAAWKLPVRLWVITLPRSRGGLIAGFNASGGLVYRHSLRTFPNGMLWASP